MKLAYPITLLEKDGQGRYVVRCPDFPQLDCEGESPRQALAAARDCLTPLLQEQVKARAHLKRPSTKKLDDVIEPPVLIAAKLALYQTMRDQDVSNVALARRMGAVEGTVRRLLDLEHRSHVEQVEAALRVLGKRLIVDLRPRHLGLRPRRVL